MRLVKAAQYLGVAPWDLERAPAYWIERAMLMQAAESRATDSRRAHQAAAARGRA